LRFKNCSIVPPGSFAAGVAQPMRIGHEVKSLADMRSADARSAGIECPAGVSLSFQVRANNVEPAEAVLARNLFAKDRARASCLSEPKNGRPCVPLVRSPCSLACRAERLARAGGCPDGSVVGPACGSQGVAPDSDPCEEVTLCESIKFLRCDIPDRTLVHDARSDVPRVD
jgi:hypothetical protein